MPKRVLSGCEVGTKIGRRVVLGHILEKGRTKCVLKCDCGRVDEVYAHLFKSGKALQCRECSRKRQSVFMRENNPVFSDLTGKRFGKLTVVKRGKDRSRGPNGKKHVCWLCKCDCGRTKTIPARSLSSGHSKSCGCLYGDTIKKKSKERKKNPQKIKRFRSSDGYMLMYFPEHPNANKSGQLREHVFIMSKHLGRPIESGETVHHKNGIRDDNRIENLELWSSAHLSGQRVDDIIEFCVDFLKKYKPSVIVERAVGEE